MQGKHSKDEDKPPVIALLVCFMPSLQGVPLQTGKIMLTFGNVNGEAGTLSDDARCSNINIECRRVVLCGGFSCVCVL